MVACNFSPFFFYMIPNDWGAFIDIPTGALIRLNCLLQVNLRLILDQLLFVYVFLFRWLHWRFKRWKILAQLHFAFVIRLDFFFFIIFISRNNVWTIFCRQSWVREWKKIDWLSCRRLFCTVIKSIIQELSWIFLTLTLWLIIIIDVSSRNTIILLMNNMIFVVLNFIVVYV